MYSDQPKWLVSPAVDDVTIEWTLPSLPVPFKYHSKLAVAEALLSENVA